MKELKFGQDARESIIKGVEITAKAVSATLGPRGTNVIFEESSYPTITKDGVTVARQVELEDKFENMGVMMAREASENTNAEASDGPQPLDSKILTPSGFIEMGDIKIGDRICGTKETVQNVLGIFPQGQKEIYEVTFGDNRVVRCCGDHIWTVTTNNGITKVMSVKEMIDSKIVTYKKCGQKQYKYFTPISIPGLDNQILPLSPYLVGILIGDGSLSMLDQTKITLGLSKEHILDKIVLPEGITFNKKFIKNKNSFNISIVGKTKDGRTIRSFLKEIGLLGTKSSTKFIPKNYLYADKKSRLALLQGLTDTDGHINNRGLLEYSTISEQLNSDVLELLRGLGKTTHNYLMPRKKDSSYSDTPIYRITELAGYKYGNKIIDIKATGQFTEMQCIKVSNEDSLYYTDDYILTHNTTSTLVLLEAMVKEANQYIITGMNPILLKRGMDFACKEILKSLKSQVKEIKTKEERLNVAMISANNDKEVGEMIIDVLDKVGVDGIVLAKGSALMETEVEYIKGTKVGGGYSTSVFVNNRRNLTYESEDPTIVITTDELNSQAQLTPILTSLLENKITNIVLFAKKISKTALVLLAQNHIQGKFTCVPVELGNIAGSKEALYDLASLVEATVVGKEEAFSLETASIAQTGKCDNVVIGRDETIVSGGKGDISKRLEEIETLLKDEKDLHATNKLKERKGRLTGKIATINIGGSSQSGQTELQYRIEDALGATRHAIREGIVEGGGVALLKCLKDKPVSTENKEFIAGIDIVYNSLKRPLQKIVENSGGSGEAVVAKVLDSGLGYNALTEEYGNLLEMGVVDPYRVSQQVLINSVATAGILLTSSVAITVKPKK